MLKIQKIGAGEIAKVKYPEQEQGLQQELAMQQGMELERQGLDTGYYSEHGRAGARWLGSAWKGLGYSEDVSQDQLVGLILEHKTASGDPVHKIHGRTTVFGLEIDVSAPKSFSDVQTIAESPIQLKMMEIWNRVLADGVARMERDYIRTRDGSGEQRHHMQTGGVAVRAYTHFLSRAQDPQLHGHLLMPNMAQELETGQWKATDTDYLYRNAKALGHWIQARLRDLSEQELGIEWGPVRNGTAEIVGVPEEYLKATSQRSQTIREKTAALAENGIRADLHMRDEIAMETRRDKVWIEDLGEWQDLQRMRAAEFGLGAEEIAALTPGARAIEPSGVDLDVLADQLFGPSGLTAMRNTFSPGDLIIALTDAGVKEFELDAAIDQLLGDPRALELDSRLGPTLTTQELVDHEQEIIREFEQGVGQAADVTVPLEVVDSVLEGVSLNLEPGQLQALYAITGSDDAFIAIEARAGVGKTTIAEIARRAFEREQIFMLGAAPTGIAVRKMRTEGIANSHTLARLHLHIKNGKTLHELLPPRARHGVLFIDEAGMAHTREAAAVIGQARRERVKVIAVGDSRQLKSVMAGGWLRHISENYGGPELTDVIRQNDELERAALNNLAARRPRDYVQYQQRKGRIHEFKIEHQDLAIRSAVDMLLDAAGRDGYHETLLMTRDNQRRQILNQHVQDIRRERGQLGEEVLMRSSEGQDLYTGDRVILKRNNMRLDVDNGTRGTILDRDPQGSLVIAIDDAGYEQRTLPPEYVSEHVRLGYASTFYGGQATTVNTAIVITQPNEVSANSGYTAFSRDRQATHIFLIGDNNGRLTPTGQLELALRRDDVEELAIEQLQEWEQGLEAETRRPQDEAVEANITAEVGQIDSSVAGEVYERSRERDLEVLDPIEDQIAAVSHAESVDGPSVEEDTSLGQQRERMLSAYNDAVSATRVEAQQELDTLRQRLDDALKPQRALREQAERLRAKSTAVGQIANAIGADDWRLRDYKQALDLKAKAEALAQQASVTKRHAAKAAVTDAAAQAAAARTRLSADQQRILDRTAGAGFSERDALDRIFKDRAEAQRLSKAADEAAIQAGFMELTLGREPGEIEQLRAQIQAAETAVEVLNDPLAAIDQRLAKTLESNEYYRREPANLQEANAWSQHWGYGLALRTEARHVYARIPELPGWRHPLNQQQLLDLKTATEHGHQLGQQLQNLDLAPGAAVRLHERGRNPDLGIGM